MDTTLTPLELINKIGVFDLDPCGFPGHNTAKEVNCLPIDGLGIEWKGKVWLNPPYSNPKPLLDKLIQHDNGVALVLASTDTKWFQECIKHCSGIFFIKGRPEFMRSDFTKVKLMRATILLSFGEECAYMLENSGIDGYFIKVDKHILSSI